MGTLQTSGAISFSQMQTALGGANPIGFNEYYRGGSYVPTYGYDTSTIRDPSSGSNYATTGTTYFWVVTASSNNIQIVWAGTAVYNQTNSNFTSYTASSGTYSGSTFYRDSLELTVDDGYGNYVYYYRLYRTYTSSSYTTINTNVPTSGAISMSQMYGARNP